MLAIFPNSLVPTSLFPEQVDPEMGIRSDSQLVTAQAPAGEINYFLQLGVGATVTISQEFYQQKSVSSYNKDGVTCVLIGELDLSGLEDVKEAARSVVDLYVSACHSEVDTNAIQASLRGAWGDFSFLVYDEKRKRLFAACSPTASSRLFCGRAFDGRLLFATTWQAIAACRDQRAELPQGCCFASAGMPMEGLSSFIRPHRSIKKHQRINSRGYICGTVFRAVSEVDLMMRSDSEGPNLV